MKKFVDVNERKFKDHLYTVFFYHNAYLPENIKHRTRYNDIAIESILEFLRPHRRIEIKKEREEIRERIKDIRKNGGSISDLARELGCTRQRLYLIEKEN